MLNREQKRNFNQVLSKKLHTTSHDPASVLWTLESRGLPAGWAEWLLFCTDSGWLCYGIMIDFNISEIGWNKKENRLYCFKLLKETAVDSYGCTRAKKNKKLITLPNVLIKFADVWSALHGDWMGTLFCRDIKCAVWLRPMQAASQSSYDDSSWRQTAFSQSVALMSLLCPAVHSEGWLSLVCVGDHSSNRPSQDFLSLISVGAYKAVLLPESSLFFFFLCLRTGRL